MENIFPSRISLVNNIIGVVQPVTLNKWLRNFLKIGNLHIKNLVCGKEEIQEKKIGEGNESENQNKNG